MAFFPGVENGYAVPAVIDLLVIFQPENAIPVRHCYTEYAEKYLTKFALVTLQPVRHRQDVWTPYYGGIPASGKLTPVVINAGR